MHWFDERYCSAFLSLAETGSFRRSADDLHVSVSGLRKWISELEDGIQVRLFERSSDGTRLTDAGRLLYADIPRLEDEFDAVLRHIRELRPYREKRVVRFGLNLFSTLEQTTRFWNALPEMGALFTPQFSFADGKNIMQSFDQDYDFILQPFLKTSHPGLCFFAVYSSPPCLYRLVGGSTPNSTDLHEKHCLENTHIVTLTQGECLEIDRSVEILKEKTHSLRINRDSKVVSFEMINFAMRTGSDLLLPDLGEYICPYYHRQKLESFPQIQYGLYYSDRKTALKDSFLAVLKEQLSKNGCIPDSIIG